MNDFWLHMLKNSIDDEAIMQRFQNMKIKV